MNPNPSNLPSTDLPSPRWTRRRALNTAWYALIGLLIGPAMCVVTGTAVAICVGISNTLLSTDWLGNIIVGVVAGIGFLFLAFLIVRAASYGTCKKHPTAPAGIAAGIAIGIAFIAAPIVTGPVVWAAPVALLPAAFFAAAAYQGGQRALREAFGPARAGVGVLCAHCGYDLSATAEHQVCPECGGIMRYERLAAE